MTRPRIFNAITIVLEGRHCQTVSASVVAEDFDEAWHAATDRVEIAFPKGEIVISALQRINP
jgi:hypothetical protein